jgi:hypothetical protein
MKFRQPIEDLKQEAKVLLRLLISGFKPEYVLNQLFADKRDIFISALPKWAKNFFIFYLGDYLPQWMEENFKGTHINKEVMAKLDSLPSSKGMEGKIEKIRGGLETRKFLLGLEFLTMLNPFTAIQSGTVWAGTPKRKNRFNNYSYRPHKMGPRKNLTTWLFGKRPFGKFYQILRDKYEPLMGKESKTMDFDFREDSDEEDEDRKGLSFKKGTEALTAPGESPGEISATEENRDRIINGLIKLGASPRDAKIYYQWKLRKVTQLELAKEYQVSDRSIRKICRKVENLIRK